MTMRYPGMNPIVARERLDELNVGIGARIYVIQRHVSSSGMTRFLSLFVMSNGEPRDITAAVAALFDEKIDDERHALKVQGCGMDMHFHTVYRLGRVLFEKGDLENDEDPGYALHYRTL